MSTARPTLNLSLIGTGFMGKAHVIGVATAAKVFDLPYQVVLHTVADATQAGADEAARTLGFARATSDWRELVADPAIDVVDITTPNALHESMALAAIAAGKHVYCEKPLAPTAAAARAMTDAAEAAGVTTQVGFNYLCNPLFSLARDMIAAGDLGEIYSYRGVHAEGFMIDPASPFTFRHEPAGGGALADLGSHALATAEYLLGPIERLMGDLVTAIGTRPDGRGGVRSVEVDDVARAFVRFASGASGSIETSWIATGRTMQHDFEVYGSKGALVFSQERLNELLLYDAADPPGRRGFRRIEAGPEHPPYGRFCLAPGHQLGFNDLKAIEVARFLDAIAGRSPEPFRFRDGLRVQTLIEALVHSAREGRWVSV